MKNFSEKHNSLDRIGKQNGDDIGKRQLEVRSIGLIQYEQQRQKKIEKKIPNLTKIHAYRFN